MRMIEPKSTYLDPVLRLKSYNFIFILSYIMLNVSMLLFCLFKCCVIIVNIVHCICQQDMPFISHQKKRMVSFSVAGINILTGVLHISFQMLMLLTMEDLIKRLFIHHKPTTTMLKDDLVSLLTLPQLSLQSSPQLQQLSQVNFFALHPFV